MPYQFDYLMSSISENELLKGEIKDLEEGKIILE